MDKQKAAIIVELANGLAKAGVVRCSVGDISLEFSPAARFEAVTQAPAVNKDEDPDPYYSSGD